MFGWRFRFGVNKSDLSTYNQIGEVLARANGFNCVDGARRFFSKTRASAVWVDEPAAYRVWLVIPCIEDAAQVDKVTCHWNVAGDMMRGRMLDPVAIANATEDLDP